MRVDSVGTDHLAARKAHNAAVRIFGARRVYLRFVLLGAVGLIIDFLFFVPELTIYQGIVCFSLKSLLMIISEALQFRRTYEALLRAYSALIATNMSETGSWAPSSALLATVEQRKVQVQVQFIASYRTGIVIMGVQSKYTRAGCLLPGVDLPFALPSGFLTCWPFFAGGILETFFPFMLCVNNLLNVVLLSSQLRAAHRLALTREATRATQPTSKARSEDASYRAHPSSKKHYGRPRSAGDSGESARHDNAQERIIPERFIPGLSSSSKVQPVSADAVGPE
jgi:hypothetical protein